MLMLTALAYAGWVKRANPEVFEAELRQFSNARELPDGDAFLTYWRTDREKFLQWLDWLGEELLEIARQTKYQPKGRKPFYLSRSPILVRIGANGRLEDVEGEDLTAELSQLFDRELRINDLTRLRQCEVCMFPFWAVQRRSRCCSARCNNVLKQREHFRRTQQAQELRDQGKSLRQISQELHTRIESVKRWLGEGDKGSEKSKTRAR